MKSATETGIELSSEEWNLLRIAYRSFILTKRDSWSSVSKQEERLSGKMKLIAKEFREKIETEIYDICNDLLGIVDLYCNPALATNPETKIFYLRMKADCLRYLAEIAQDENKRKFVTESEKVYKEAFDVAKSKLQPINSLRLGLVVNYSVFYKDVMMDGEKACQLTNQAIEEAKKALKHEQEIDNDSIVIIKVKVLLQSLLVWTSIQTQGFVLSLINVEELTFLDQR